MKFYSVHLLLEGAVNPPRPNVEENADIADEFSRLSQSLGYEGAPDDLVGLWSTQPVYDEHSSLVGNFLRRGLVLDVLCDGTKPLPFAALFLTLQEALGRFGTCSISKLTMSCETTRSRGPIRKARPRGDFNAFAQIANEATTVPQIECSSIALRAIDLDGVALAPRTERLPFGRCDLARVALPISALWSEGLEAPVRRQVYRVHFVIE